MAEVMVPLVTLTRLAEKPVTGSENVTVNGMGDVAVGLVAVVLRVAVGAVASTVKVVVVLLALTAWPLAWAVAYTE
jgi:hypothetical protein